MRRDVQKIALHADDLLQFVVGLGQAGVLVFQLVVEGGQLGRGCQDGGNLPQAGDGFFIESAPLVAATRSMPEAPVSSRKGTAA